MSYTNSSLATYIQLSPNRTSPRGHAIDTITIHCMAGDLTVESCGNLFAHASRKASSNYGIGSDGRIALYVEERDRSWCSSSKSNDDRAVTIEVASGCTSPYAVKPAAYDALVRLCADICKRNGIRKLIWSDSKSDRVNHRNGVNMTCHRDFANKACPGDYLYSREGDIATKVNTLLDGSADSSPQRTSSPCPYTVRITASELNIRKGPGTGYAICGSIQDRGIYTIVQEAADSGTGKWGELKSGAGWICLACVEKISSGNFEHTGTHTRFSTP